ncbi:MAG: hypothetical protein FJ125_17505 [Deltaproteobacteria bacterium]|nr:hypothetical protein [Deltaproteobacteria bacterium]
MGCDRVGPRQEGEPCSTGGQCGPTLACIGPEDGAFCRRICATDQECLPDGACNVRVTNAAGIELGFVCSPRQVEQGCTLLGQACPAGQGCYNADATLSRFVCMASGQAAQGEGCARINDCLPGMLCMSFGEGASFECAQVCSLESGDVPCDDDHECEDLLPARSDGGLCRPAQD